MKKHTYKLRIDPGDPVAVNVGKSLKLFGLSPSSDQDDAISKAKACVFKIDHDYFEFGGVWAVKPEMREFFRGLSKAVPGFAFFLPLDRADLRQAAACLIEEAVYGEFEGTKPGCAVVYHIDDWKKLSKRIASDAATLAGQLGFDHDYQKRRWAEIETYLIRKTVPNSSVTIRDE